jgi:hypothetical protein
MASSINGSYGMTMLQALKADGSLQRDVARSLSAANSPPGETPGPVIRESLDWAQAQFGRHGAQSRKTELQIRPTASVGIRVKVLRRLASAMYGLAQIGYMLCPRCFSLPFPGQSAPSSTSQGQGSPDRYSLEELIELLVCEKHRVPVEEQPLPAAMSYPNMGNQDNL